MSTSRAGDVKMFGRADNERSVPSARGSGLFGGMSWAIDKCFYVSSDQLPKLLAEKVEQELCSENPIAIVFSDDINFDRLSGSPPPRIGLVGSQLLALLVEQGYRVSSLVRRNDKNREYPGLQRVYVFPEPQPKEAT